MRYFVKIAAGVLAVLVFLMSCGARETDICELALAVCDEMEESGGRGILYLDRTRNSSNGDFHELSKDNFGFLYTGKKETPSCINRITGYAVRLSLDGNGCEIHIIECVNPSDTDEVSAMLLERVERLQGAEILQYAPESYEMYFRGAEVFTEGRYAFLLATPDNEAVKAVIDGYL